MRFHLDNQTMATLLLFSSFAAVPLGVDAHGYASSPRSRNWFAHEYGKALNAGTATDPLKENCHHCLNQGDTAQGDVCGISNDSGINYMHPKNALGGDLAPHVQATYREGETITIESVLTSHHQGHQVIKACPNFYNPTQDCFDAHPLEFVKDELYGAPKDVNYPERGYFAPNDGSAEGPGSYSLDTSWGMSFKMYFKLPEGVNGDLVLLQWHYVTGNSCRHPGYDVYPWPAGWEPDNMGPCPDPLPTNGANVPPEQFWNCMEVKILPSAPTISPAPSKPPVPTVTPTAVPTPEFKCCSQNFIECVTWAGNTEAECNNHGDTWWITPPAPGSCIQRWQGGCSADSDCCYPGYCDVNNQCNKNPNPPPPTPPTPALPTPALPTLAPTSPSVPSPPTPPTPPTNVPGVACCTLNYKDCHANAFCNANIEQCLNQCDKKWLPDGPLSGCTELWKPCTTDSECCHTGVCISGQCEGEEYATPAPPTAPIPTPPTAPTPTASPSGIPTKTPTPPTPTSSPSSSPSRPPVNLQLFSTDQTMTSFEALLKFSDLHYVVQEDPPIYSVVAEGGAAGSDVVSEGQGYGLLISGITIASMDVNDPNRFTAMNLFYGYFNAWKRMAELSNDPCQEIKFCNGGTTNCLPGWKFPKELNYIIGTGSAPDGDADAITGMIFAVKAVANDASPPDWFEEVSTWADASATQFMYHSTVASSTGKNRIVKLGSCWGGWDADGNNPSYHSPGSYRMMRDYQATFAREHSLPNFNDGLSMYQRWNQLVSTSYKYLEAAQCSDIGIVPNWLTVTENSADGTLTALNGNFSASDTAQYEFGSEASRTMWRVTFDAATYPCESGSASDFLEPVHDRLGSNFDPAPVTGSPWPESTLVSCKAFDEQPENTRPMGAWIWIQFMYSPVYSTLVVPSANINATEQQSMVDAAGLRIDSSLETNALSYYHKSWSVIGILTLNGDIEKASRVLDKTSCDSLTSYPTKSPVTAPPRLPVTPSPTKQPVTSSPTKSPVTSTPTKTLTAAPTKPPAVSVGCYSNNYKDCVPDNLSSGGDSHYKTWLPTGAQSNCVALWGECTGQSSSCCEPAQCFGDDNHAACVPPDGCYSNNYKDCIPENLASVGDSSYKIWLPTGSESNCISLWGECTGQAGACCGPAECFGDSEYAACVPYSVVISA